MTVGPKNRGVRNPGTSGVGTDGDGPTSFAVIKSVATESTARSSATAVPCGFWGLAAPPWPPRQSDARRVLRSAAVRRTSRAAHVLVVSRTMRRNALGIGLAALVGFAPLDVAGKRSANVVVPAKRKAGGKRLVDPDPSRGGTRKGGIEFGLGSLTAALSLGLIGRGIWEAVRAQRTAAACQAGTTNDPTCALDAQPGRAGKIAAGLSFGFAIPAAIASGFLFRYAVRTRRAYLRHQAQRRDVALAPWVDQAGGGVSFEVRF